MLGNGGQLDVQTYLDEVRSKFLSGHATEHSYRPALQKLFESIDPGLTVVNEPKRSDAGMPDFLFQRGDIPLGWAEAKDIDKDVIKLKGYSVEQRKRYEKAFPNLIYTNGVDFEFIREGQSVHFVSIADFLMGLQPNPERFEELERQLKLFAEQKPISIRSAAKLAEMMAAKAAIIKDEIGIALGDDSEFRSGLGGQFKSFKANLLPNLTPDEFADIYAETITYGMFAARFHDDDLSTFSRQEALEKLPASNPFLKGLFRYIAGTELPRRLEYIVDDLVQLMRASDPHSLFEGYGKWDARNDPFVHFYEDFLAAYNPKKRKSRGVWYTPEPVVDFIVRAVDDVLKTEFGLADGLADTSKVTVDWDTGQDDPKTGKPRTIRKDVHKVQILDPATGTGTFLAKAVQLIADRVKVRAPGKWSNYVEEDLLPRLHGFELLMASYAMCHMKLDMMLTETGYKPSAKPPRLSVWLTNSLEPAEREVRDLFFQPLAEEARGASEVKRQTPIMCVIGNPPYSLSSQNRGEWITSLLRDYKEGLGERKVNLDDDYIKFIRMCQFLIEKNGCGVVGLITNNSFLDGITHRRMRQSLLESFDRVYVLDLHGSSVREERAPDGGVDENVFDIMQGVAITIFVKTGRSESAIKQNDFFGRRDDKYAQLWEAQIADDSFVSLAPQEPSFFFKGKDFSAAEAYDKLVAVQTIFQEQNSGIKTDRDSLFIDFSNISLRQRIATLLSGQFGFDFASQYNVKDSGSYAITTKIAGKVFAEEKVVKYHYRPFDIIYIYYDPEVISRPAEKTSRHLLAGENLFLLAPRQAQKGFHHIFVTASLPDVNLLSNAGMFGCGYSFPLYIYPLIDAQADAFAAKKRSLNLEPKVYAAICKAAGIDPADQAGPGDDFRAATGDTRPSEVKVFDYIYGVLHSPDYRETFAELLKIAFPRIPYPPSPEVFRQISEKGEQLRRLHLMEAPAIGDTPYAYLGDGDDIVSAGHPKFEAGKVHISKDQYFDGVPQIAWTFHIGGYQPAQKWLKDRRGRALSWEDIGHYQKIVKILAETDRIMKEIELPLE
jgi:predicted helicase